MFIIPSMSFAQFEREVYAHMVNNKDTTTWYIISSKITICNYQRNVMLPQIVKEINLIDSSIVKFKNKKKIYKYTSGDENILINLYNEKMIIYKEGKKYKMLR